MARTTNAHLRERDQAFLRTWKERRLETQSHCAYCGRLFGTDGDEATVDHIVPLKPNDGGPAGDNDPSNLVLVCRTCNISKNNRRLGQDWLPGYSWARVPFNRELKRIEMVLANSADRDWPLRIGKFSPKSVLMLRQSCKGAAWGCWWCVNGTDIQSEVKASRAAEWERARPERERLAAEAEAGEELAVAIIKEAKSAKLKINTKWNVNHLYRRCAADGCGEMARRLAWFNGSPALLCNDCPGETLMRWGRDAGMSPRQLVESRRVANRLAELISDVDSAKACVEAAKRARRDPAARQFAAYKELQTALDATQTWADLIRYHFTMRQTDAHQRFPGG